MSKIEKLSILGIRSFDNTRSESIHFYTPLTLVVGQNGCGKTTIIECLKYVLTGMQPPNTKVGGAFVHDPNVAGEREVMAEAKLAFTSSTGAALVAARRLQLSVKKNSRSLKTLESSLRMVKNAERTVISSRVAELDLILPQYLGVSTAVIDNVIFCHQDESLWPMSDPSTLKKKFDEIFEAQKYTKAIDNIKQIRKKQNEELGKYKIVEEHAKADKARAERIRKKVASLESEIESHRKECEVLVEKITVAGRLRDQADKDAEDYAKILGALEGKRYEARSQQSTIDRLLPNLKEVSESDAWLEATLTNFEEQQRELQEKKREQSEIYVELKDRIQDLRSQTTSKMSEKGKYQQDKEEHDRHLLRRRAVVSETAKQHEMRGFDDLVNDTQVEDFMFRINKAAKDLRNNLEQYRKEADAEKTDAQGLVNRLSEKKTALHNSKAGMRNLLKQYDHDASTFQKRVDEIKVDESTRAVIESKSEDLSSRLQRARDASNSADWTHKINDANDELRTHEAQSQRFSDDLIQSTKRAGELGQFTHLKKEIKDRQRGLDTLLKAHSPRIIKLIGNDWVPQTVAQVLEEVLRDAKRQVAADEDARANSTKEMDQVQFKLKAHRDELAAKKAQLAQCERDIRAVISDDPSEYEETLQNAKSRADYARDEASNLTGLHDYFQKVLETISGNKPVCRTCQRAFKGPQDPAVEKMKQRMGEMLKKTQDDSNQAQVEEAEADYQRVLDMSVQYEMWKKLRDDSIPAVEKVVSELTEQRQGLIGVLENHDKKVEGRRQVQSDLETISTSVANIAKHHTDIQNLQTQIDEFLSKQSQQTSVRALDDIQQDLAGTSQKIELVKKLISRLTTEQEQSRSEIANLELEDRDLKGELAKVDHQLERKTDLVTRVEEFRAQAHGERTAIDKLDQDLEAVEPEISTAKARFDEILQRTQGRAGELTQEHSKVVNSINALNMLNEQIEAFTERDGPGRLAATLRSIQNLERDIRNAESEQALVVQELNKMENEIRGGEATRRMYDDNLNYRRATKALRQLQQDIEDLSAHNAEADRERLNAERERYAREVNILSGQQAGLMGQMKSKDAQLETEKQDYDTDGKGANPRYKEAHIRVETTKHAVNDLGQYAMALEKAIMRYHSLKMEEVNAIIEDLWRRTYQGNDIDSIQIRAENETGRGNRSYNYRVVMTKSGSELDMRSRCSAGQKVLVSIIIRLALAECFSSNCGLIALDEPTTNLDRENMKGLAHSLHEIIRMRSQQANFQLIIITHDESFLREMQCGDFADHYWRVSRNERSKSIIEKQSIMEVLSD